MQGDFVHVVPDLVVEILSKGTRKRDDTIKRQLYERAGVTEVLDRRSEERRAFACSVERVRGSRRP